MSEQLNRLLRIMATLRHPQNGCEWDRAQRFETIVPHTIEEAYEVADAVARGDIEDIRDELGDLLFQVIFQSRIAEEADQFAFDDVARSISDKLEARHPHIFGDAPPPGEARDERWEALKAKGARVQRLLFASTGTKDPTASKTLYIEGLAAPDTINTMPEETLLALAEADARIQALPTDGEAARAQLARFEEAGISVDALGLELQQKGADAFVKSWESLLARVQEKAQAVTSGR